MLVTGACLTRYKHAPPDVGYHVKCDRCWSNDTSVHMEIHQKNWAPPITPFKVIGTDTDPSDNYDFLLTFHSNSVTIFYTTIYKI